MYTDSLARVMCLPKKKKGGQDTYGTLTFPFYCDEREDGVLETRLSSNSENETEVGEATPQPPIWFTDGLRVLLKELDGWLNF